MLTARNQPNVQVYFRLLSIRNTLPTKCTTSFFRCLCYIITLNIPTCFDLKCTVIFLRYLYCNIALNIPTCLDPKYAILLLRYLYCNTYFIEYSYMFRSTRYHHQRIKRKRYRIKPNYPLLYRVYMA